LHCLQLGEKFVLICCFEGIVALSCYQRKYYV